MTWHGWHAWYMKPKSLHEYETLSICRLEVKNWKKNICLLLCEQQRLFTEVTLDSSIDRFSQQETCMQMDYIDSSVFSPSDNPRVQPAAIYAGESSFSQSTRLPVPTQWMWHGELYTIDIHCTNIHTCEYCARVVCCECIVCKWTSRHTFSLPHRQRRYRIQYRLCLCASSHLFCHQDIVFYFLSDFISDNNVWNRIHVCL